MYLQVRMYQNDFISKDIKCGVGFESTQPLLIRL